MCAPMLSLRGHVEAGDNAAAAPQDTSAASAALYHMLFTLHQIVPPPPDYRATHVCLKSHNACLPQVMLSTQAVNLIALMVHLKALSLSNGL